MSYRILDFPAIHRIAGFRTLSCGQSIYHYEF